MISATKDFCEGQNKKKKLSIPKFIEFFDCIDQCDSVFWFWSLVEMKCEIDEVIFVGQFGRIKSRVDMLTQITITIIKIRDIEH